MFYSYHILVQKNSNFTLIWRYMHDRKKIHRDDLLAFNIANACNDLRGYVPSGVLTLSELQNKMSLYLLGQLFYGITLVYDYQVSSFCQFVNETSKSLLRVSEKERPERKRKHGEYGLGLDEYADVVPSSKQKRPKRAHSCSVLDLNDPSSYVAEQPSRNVPHIVEPLFGADDMFQVPGIEGRFEPAEELLKIQQEVADFRSQELKSEQEMAIDVSLKDPKVSVGWHSGFANELLESARARTTSGFSGQEALKRSALFEDFPQTQHISPPLASPPLPASVPIYRQEPENLELQDEFMLEPLSEMLKTAEPRRKKRRLFYDEVARISSDRILDQINDYSDLLRLRNELFVNSEEFTNLSANTLLHPRPCHILDLNGKLHELFDSVLSNKQRPIITFNEANQLGIKELRQRYWDKLDFDVSSWTSDMLNETLNAAGVNGVSRPDDLISSFQPHKESQAAIMARRNGFEAEEEEDHQPPPKVSMATLCESLDQMSNLEIEARRFSSFEPARFSFPQAQFTDFNPNEQFLNDDFNLTRPSLKTARELSQRTLESPELNELYQEIVETAGVNACKFSEFTPSHLTKQIAAKKFYNLLCLLTQKEVEVDQLEAYGEIFVRLTPTEEFVV